ncbi:MAG TPA: hypothetical protein VFR82_10460 [Nitrospira sp.]|nr:hypothetical protein [Nitrospira sp.]
MVNDPGPVHSTTPAPPREIPGETAIYRHEPSGIMERSGSIPVWLKVVAFGLIVWGVYYAWRYAY